MNLQKKSEMLIAFFILGWIAGVVLLGIIFHWWVPTLFSVIWFVVFACSQYKLLACPHCGGFSGVTEWHGFKIHGVSPGGKCRQCGKPY